MPTRDFKLIKGGIGQTEAERLAGVTPTNNQYAALSLPRYMSSAQLADWIAGTGLVDMGTAMRTWASVATNHCELVMPPGLYLAEGTANSSSYGLTGTNDIVAAIDGKTNVRVVAYGATLKQTSATDSTLGAFLFHDCIDCGVLGLRVDGVYPHGASLSTCGVAVFVGACDGCFVDGHIDGGRALAVMISGDATPDTVGPVNSRVVGSARDSEYGVVYTHADYGHDFDITTDTVLRSVFITGTSGINGDLESKDAGATDINIATRKDGSVAAGAGDVKDIDIRVNSTGANEGGRIMVTDGTACLIENIKIHGTITDADTDGWQLSDFDHTGTVLNNIDLSGLKIVRPGSNGLSMIPDVACTINNLKLPEVIDAVSTGILITNTNDAVITGVERIGGRWKYSGGGSVGLITVSGGTVGKISKMRLVGVEGVSNQSGGIDFSITVVNGLVIDQCSTPKAIYVVGSTNVYQKGINDQLARGFSFAGALADATDYSWLNSFLVTSGSATINSLKRVVPGAVLHFAFNGGTPTFADGTNMKLNTAAGNFTGTAEDTLTLMCIDPPSGGPLETSTMYEVTRSVN